MRKSIALVGVLALFAGSANADLLWDNGMVPNGVNGRAISPPSFPDAFGKRTVNNDCEKTVTSLARSLPKP